MALGPAYEAAVNEEDFDRALNLCRVFTEMGESFLHQIVDMPGRDLGDLRTLSILLSCVQHNQYEVVIATDSLHMSSEATVGLIKGVCKILEGVESPDKITEESLDFLANERFKKTDWQHFTPFHELQVDGNSTLKDTKIKTPRFHIATQKKKRALHFASKQLAHLSLATVK
ncbi:predicted protein [Nematostella vectensis]|uniref:Uncharacterized protein n=1 Tax=Nematostella vectensis TaxID=45351 RepID=A7SBS6_NEMVE|nr:predicted protein [Nematostella vectensis]|eukprot:XP_001630884.1 predicted protein [Nematostella vectensis]